MSLHKSILEKLKTKDRVIIAIDGPCASGKSTFAQDLCEEFDGVLFHMDDFFLPIGMKTEKRLNEIGGNVHYERFNKEVLNNIYNESLTYQKYNCQKETLESPITVGLPRVAIVEGAYSLRTDLRGLYDVTVLLAVETNTQLDRLKKRNPKLLDRFINEWIPLENRYFEQEQLDQFVDYIIDTTTIHK